jgi:NADH-quinone oxidoreductase subunit N
MDSRQLVAIAPIITLSTVAVVVMLTIAIKRNFILISSVTACGILLTLSVIAVSWQEAPIQSTLLIRIDNFALFFMALLLMATLTVIGFCYDYFKTHEGENEELMLLMLTAVLGTSVLVSSSHFATFFIGLEILSISLFALIGYPLNQSRPLEAAIKYLILSGVSSAFLLMGMALIYAQSGELNFSGIGKFLALQPTMNAMILDGVTLVLAGLGFKLSLVPFHLWTPDVYEGAPAPITGFIATVSKGAVFALLLRFFIGTDSQVYPPLLTVFSLIAVFSILVGNLLALLQTNVKRVLAYSSIAHMGYLMVAFIASGIVAPALAVESVIFYIVAYSIMTIGAFGVISVLSTPQIEAGDIALYRGLFWRRPWLAGAFTLMLLSLAGIPLTAGFIAKFYIFTSGGEARLWGLMLAVVVGSGLGLYYYLKIIITMSMTVVEAPFVNFRESSNHWVSLATLATLSILLVWVGIYPNQLITFIVSVSNTIR